MCHVTQYLIVGNKPCVVKKTPEQKLFPKEILAPTPIPEKKEEIKEEPQPVTFIPQNFTPATGTLSADLLFDMINQHRASISLPAYQKEPQVCSVADARKDEIVHEMFVTGALHAGFWGDNYPFWATENMIWQHTEAEAMNWWLNSPVHRSAIEGNYAYACGTCNGEVCNMIFTSLAPKATESAQFAYVQPVITPKIETPKIELKPQEIISKAVDNEKAKLPISTTILR